MLVSSAPSSSVLLFLCLKLLQFYMGFQVLAHFQYFPESLCEKDQGPSCSSTRSTAPSPQIPSDILVTLQDNVRECDKSRNGDEMLSWWLNPPINVLYAFSATLGGSCWTRKSHPHNLSALTPLVSFFLVFSPAQVIFAGVAVLLLFVILVHFCLEVIPTLKSVTGRPRMSKRAKTP
jgi:hypothetical protein